MAFQCGTNFLRGNTVKENLQTVFLHIGNHLAAIELQALKTALFHMGQLFNAFFDVLACIYYTIPQVG